jgi:hypothetical protein
MVAKRIWKGALGVTDGSPVAKGVISPWPGVLAYSLLPLVHKVLEADRATGPFTILMPGRHPLDAVCRGLASPATLSLGSRPPGLLANSTLSARAF